MRANLDMTGINGPVLNNPLNPAGVKLFLG